MQILSQFHDLILCIISALEARDQYTSHHSSRVVEMTETICELMGLDEAEKEMFAFIMAGVLYHIRENLTIGSKKFQNHTKTSDCLQSYKGFREFSGTLFSINVGRTELKET